MDSLVDWGRLDLKESALRCRLTYGFSGLAIQVRSEVSDLVLNEDSWRGWHFGETAPLARGSIRRGLNRQ